MSEIKGVIFDYGGTLTHDGSFAPVYARFAEGLGKDTEYARELIKLGVAQFLRGKVSESEFWEILEKAHRAPISLEQRDIWVSWSELKPAQPMVDLVKRLKDDGYKLAILSNATKPAADMIREHGGYDGFDAVILSCELGYAKPELEMYEAAIKALDLDAKQCLFVDDQQRMLDPAGELGMQTALATEPADTVKAVETALGVVV